MSRGGTIDGNLINRESNNFSTKSKYSRKSKIEEVDMATTCFLDQMYVLNNTSRALKGRERNANKTVNSEWPMVINICYT